MIRNEAGQVVTANLIALADGLPITTGTVTVKVLGNGGTKTTGLGTIENEGDGTWSYFPTQGETDYAAVTYSFSHPDALRVDVQVHPDTPSSDCSSSPSVPSGDDAGGDVPFGLDEPVVESSEATAATTSIDVLALATGPAAVTIDGVSVTQRSIDDAIKADRHAAAQRAAANSNTLGVKFMRVNPGSAVRD